MSWGINPNASEEEFHHLRSSLTTLMTDDVENEPKKGDKIVSLLDENQKGVIVQIDD